MEIKQTNTEDVTKKYRIKSNMTKLCYQEIYTNISKKILTSGGIKWSKLYICVNYGFT